MGLFRKRRKRLSVVQMRHVKTVHRKPGKFRLDQTRFQKKLKDEHHEALALSAILRSTRRYR